MAEMDYTKAQDVSKDVGQSVEFVVLGLTVQSRWQNYKY